MAPRTRRWQAADRGSGRSLSAAKRFEDGRAMINLDDEVVEEYLTECREHVAAIEAELLAMEKGGPQIDDEVLNRAIRAVHSVRGGGSLFALVKVRELAHQMEVAMAQICSRLIVPKLNVVCVLLHVNDWLSGLIEDPGTSNEADINEVVGVLVGLCTDQTSVV